MVNKVRTINFLPEIFQTESNRQFLSATLDVLTSQPNLRRVEGFIGEKYGYGIGPNDKYVVEPTKSRRDYQLDPSVIFLKQDTQTAQDFINYPGIIDALKLEGGIVDNHDRLFNNQFYSWDPFVDYDKIVNYSQYYWIPFGPDPIPITNNIVYETGNYTVTNDDNGYNFSEISNTNPPLSLLRGGTYTFTIGSEFSGFWILLNPGINAIPDVPYGDPTYNNFVPIGVSSNNGENNVTITFNVPDSTTLPINRLYYQSSTDPLSVGVIDLIETNSQNFIEISSILGKKNYTSPNGVKFTNGLKVQFTGNVTPSSYQNQTYYVEGVGESIVLLDTANYIVTEASGSAIFNEWDQVPWDMERWDVQLYISLFTEYITINRNSRDLNAWTRANRWFHQDVINTTTQFLGQVTYEISNTVTRAQRPIIEYRGNLKLYNAGVVSPGPVNIVSSCSDAFSLIEGQQISSIPTNLTDGINLIPGNKIIFASDDNPAVRQNVYTVTTVPAGPNGEEVVNLVVDTTYNIVNYSQVFVLDGTNAGTSWWYNDNNISWNNGQRKTDINQYPLFDIFDIDNNSLSDSEVYPATTFGGTKLFSYTPGTGKNDAVLGFPIAYSSPSTIGDILFTVNLNSEKFTYNSTNNNEPVTNNINVGYVHQYIDNSLFNKMTGYVTAAGPLTSTETNTKYSGTSFQYQVFEFPEIEKLNYSSSNVSLTIDYGGSNYSVGDKLKISGDLLGGSTPENDLYFTVSSVINPPGGLPGQITGIDITTINGNCVAINQTFQNLLSTSITGIGSSAIFNIDIVGTGTTTFVCDIPAKQDVVWAETLVYYDDEILDKNDYSVVVTPNTTEITVTSNIGVKITALVISDKISKTAYYQTAINLENNPFNENIESVTVGDLRNQYRSIFINAPNVEGTLFGNNNIHDLGNLNNFGTAIIQNSSSLVLPGVFLRKQFANLFNALQFNRDQYQIYKSLLVDLAFKSDYNIYQSPSDILDNIVFNISNTKNNTNAFFWSDMIFSGNPYATNNYTFNTNANTATFSINSDIWNDGKIFTEANYNGVAVYLTRVIDNRNTYVQLLKNIDYFVSSTAPSLTVNYAIEAGDIITIKEYNQTYGSYCPSTPSKLGLYQIYEPAIVSEQSATGPIYFILGHDGSLNRLYGDYTPDPLNPIKIPDTTLNDIRDIVLFEFEKRVFNNYKVNTPVAISSDDVIPGQFRTTEYSYDEVLKIYSIDFLNWVGTNRIDYKTQYYRANDKFTFNYNQTSNKLSDEALKQGYWKGIYNYFYDTYDPANSPWEMLGLLSKPNWWDSRYGAAPYTSGNTYMWQEIADGYIWNDGDPYVNPKKIRPGLLNVLPVDSIGNLVSPFVSVMGNYSRLTFNRDWRVGDFGPAESSYTRSSAYPFDLMRLLALTKPANFFNLFVDIDRYRFNEEFGQYLYDDRYHLNPSTVEIYGNGTAKHSYINWVVDYINQLGEDGTTSISSLLHNLDVRLTYRMAGFTSKNYLKFLVEKATPNSKNTSLLIPDESYAVLLYDNEPVEKISYSSVIVQKTTNGYTVWGNSKNTQYFTSLVPKPGYFQNISANKTTIQIPKEFYLDREVVTPYGTEFYSIQAVSEFLQSYGQYLTKQGVVFDNVINGVLYDWVRIVQEFMIWAEQGWEVGSIISLNPNAKNFVVNRENLIVQPLTFREKNFLLNQNLIPIQSQDACIDRDSTKFGVKILNDGDSIAYTNLNLYNIEHAIVFDNTTQFNDIIYNLTTGLRQPRLLLKGYKTSEWDGYVDANGFILNENNVKEWEPNTKYPKNKIVFYKNKYWVAKKLIEPQVKFSSEDWIESDYGQIKTGLLPNPSTTAYEATFFYDTTRSNLENDADLLSYSLIGFRPRDYLAAADISDTSQINVYKNIVKSKGTQLLAESFKTATFDQGPIDYVIEENWAIKEGTFGSVLNRNYVEVRLDQNLLTGNPTVIGFNTSGSNILGTQQTIPISSVINYGREPLTPYFLPVDTDSYTIENGIPSAGYVNINDAKFQAYTFEDLNIDLNNINNVYVNDNIWVANHNNSWDIFTAISLNNQIVQIDNNLNGTIKVIFSNHHNLIENDLIAIINVDVRVNGFYKVKTIQNLNSIVVDKVLDNTVVKILNNGQGLKFVSRRYEQPSDGYNSTLVPMSWSNRKIWSDYYTNNQWAVYGASPVYRSIDSNIETAPYAVSIGYTNNIGQVVADGNGNIIRYYNTSSVETVAGGIGQNSKIISFGDYIYCSSPDENSVYFYQLVSNSLILVDVIDLSGIISTTGAIAVSKDNLWLYVADSNNQEIALYYYNGTGYTYVDTLSDPSVPVGSNWGFSIATSIDGSKLIVGAPNEDSGILTDSGAVYIYNRRTQRFYSDGSSGVFTLENAAPSNIATIYVNDVVVSASIVGSNVTFSSAPAAGSVVAVSTGYLEFVKKIQSNDPHIGGLFGYSVDTNRYGAEIIIGTPYELTTVNNVKGVEGAVYRYTNEGQRYGTVYGTFTGSITGTIFIDGYIVNYNGTISDVVDAINGQTPTNIIASYSGNVLTITVLNNTVEVLYNILDVTGPINDINDLGIGLYTNSQIIYNPNLSNVSEFGSNVKMNERDSLLISATTETRLSPTTFDYTENCNQDDTIFDNGTTMFIDSFYNDGVVYMYDYLPAHNENIDNVGKYAFGQYITTDLIAENSPLPKFGSVLAYNDNNVLAGTSTWSVLQGGYVRYNTSWEPVYECEINKPTSWYVDKLPLTIVDINSINNISLYDVTNNATLEYLDYIDPVNGKILGAISTNIDYFENVDPAVYSVNGTSWGIDKVGHTWLNLNTIRLLNYHQPDVTYNAQNYGKAFPGSTAEIYTWVESNRPPLSYAGIGSPVYFDKYTTATTLDRATNSLVTKYYFWVQNFNQVPVGKTLSPITLSLYLLNPLASGIAYMAPITTNIIALMNSNEYIQSQTSALHIGYGIPSTEDEMHTSWSLIRSNNFEDFLSGLPTVLNDNPTGLYLKYIESFSGFDKQDNPVPTPTLPDLVKYGTSFRPNQSMFVNRLLALKNYINYANNILIKFPIVETRNLGYLRKTESTFNVTNYWKLVDWWAEGYSSDTKPVIEVNNLNDLQTLLNNNLYTGIGGVDVFLENGLIAKVKSNRLGNSEYYVYNSDTQLKWIRIGAQNSTIQLLPTIYEIYGWSTENWGGVWDKNPSQEVYWIIRWLNEVCYTSDLAIERNKSLILMFNFIQSESLEQNNYLPWLNKTSLIDVNHRIRGLLPYKKYQRDNQEFLEGFLNEIKPYHVVIKNFIFSYNGEDLYGGNCTDFDLPAQYNTNFQTFISPKLVYETPEQIGEYDSDNIIWDQSNYNQWFNNFGLSINKDEFEDTPINSQPTLQLYVIPATALTQVLNVGDTVAYVKDVSCLPTNGSIIIAQEIINYNSLDLLNNTITGLTRGIDGTTESTHVIGETVYLNAPEVLVYNNGRGYLEPPRINAEINSLTFLGYPRENASLEPIMSVDKVIGVSVLSSGEGYPETPKIVVANSSITGVIESISSNIIQITGHDFITGDCVKFEGTPNTGSELLNDNYYYVRVLSANTIALYLTYKQAVPNYIGVTQLSASITNADTDIPVTNIDILPSPAGTILIGNEIITYTGVNLLTSSLTGAVRGSGATAHNINDWVQVENTNIVATDSIGVTGYTVEVDGRLKLSSLDTGSLSVCARAYTLTTSRPVREMKLTLKFDRISYASGGWDTTNFDVDLWSSSSPYEGAASRILEYYNPTLSMPGKNLPQLMNGLRYPNNIYLGQNFVNPISLDTSLASYPFTSVPMPPNNNYYNVDGGNFLDGYGPEELVPGYVSDSMLMTITTDDPTLTWEHSIEINKYGDMTVYTDSGNVLDTLYLNQWWYGAPVNPSANTTLTLNSYAAAVSLRS